MNISENWTPEERLQVVDKISKEMEYVTLPDPDEVIDWARRLHFVATYPEHFLNLNRNNIIGREPC